MNFKEWLVQRQREAVEETGAEAAPESSPNGPTVSLRSANGLLNGSRGRRKDRDMRGLLADVNVQGHLLYLHQLLENLGLWPVLAELKLELVTFRDLKLPPRLDDRSLWNYCQDEGWVLFTENRNHDDPGLAPRDAHGFLAVGLLTCPDACEQGKV